MKIEHRCLSQNLANTRLEKRDDKDARIEGHAAIYFDPADPQGTQYRLWEDYYERIMPGAFDDAIRNDDVRCLFNHDVNQVLGRSKSGTLTLSVDSRGLRYACDCPDTSVGRDVATMIERGDVSGSSFGFLPVETQYREEDGVWYRELLKVQLFDVSPVTFPAYHGTTTEIARRSLDQHRQHISEARGARISRDLAFLELESRD